VNADPYIYESDWRQVGFGVFHSFKHGLGSIPKHVHIHVRNNFDDPSTVLEDVVSTIDENNILINLTGYDFNFLSVWCSTKYESPIDSFLLASTTPWLDEVEAL
jgi:hypothetical protein